MSEHHDAPLAKAALCTAVAVRGGDVDGVIFHSDKGGEYTGDLFAQACDAMGVTQSMGRVGSALDNAAAESFNSTLEQELLSRGLFATKADARRAVARFIDAYNHRRRHSSCEMLPAGRLPTTTHRASRRRRPNRPGRVTPAPLTFSHRSNGTTMPANARLQPPISNTPRFRGKPSGSGRRRERPSPMTRDISAGRGGGSCRMECGRHRVRAICRLPSMV
jgi:transposase InsO family protein